jgi:hypothetical protein
MRRLENFDMRVEFHPQMVPPCVWWAVWDGVEGDIIEREPAVLGSQHEVHRYLRAVEKTVVGFSWSWHAEACQQPGRSPAGPLRAESPPAGRRSNRKRP